MQSDDDKYIDLKGEVDEAMKNASFQVLSVTVDTLHNWYGKISGSSVDYAATVSFGLGNRDPLPWFNLRLLKL